MATSLNNLNEDLLFYEALKHYAFEKITKKINEHNKFLISHGVIQIETLLELAISRAGKLKRDATHGRDFSDKSDAKKVTSSWRMNDIKRGSWTNSYTVSNIHTKQGALRIMGYNRIANRFDYYVIPKRAYKHLKGKRLDIILDAFNGCYDEPTPTGEKANCHWNRYRKSSFLEMATASGK